MGSIYSGFPETLGNFLIEDIKIKNFVETGTYIGITAKWASERFDKVYTVEQSPEIYEEVAGRLSNLSNTKFYLGDSPKVLKKIIPNLNGKPAIFWLDAHWSGGKTSGLSKECPVLDEINIIYKNTSNAVIVIDDARFFLFPPPEPHKVVQWPSIAELVNVLMKQDRYVVVWKDVVIAIPSKLRRKFISFFRSQDRAEMNNYITPVNNTLTLSLKNILTKIFKT